MKQFLLFLIVCGTIFALLLAGCSTSSTLEPPTPTPTPTPQPPTIEEIAFESGSFHLVGDLRLPGGKGPFLLVIKEL